MQEMAKSSDILTTGEVAKICKVAPRTVSKWFDSGQLGGYRIPGSKDRRIPLAELLVFMDKHGIPRDGSGPDKQTALIVGNGLTKSSLLWKVLKNNRFEVQSADSPFAAGVLAEKLKPRIIFWEIEASSPTGKPIPHGIRAAADLPQTKIIALTDTQQQMQDLADLGFDALLSHPLEESDLDGLIAELADITQ